MNQMMQNKKYLWSLLPKENILFLEICFKKNDICMYMDYGDLYNWKCNYFIW